MLHKFVAILPDFRIPIRSPIMRQPHTIDIVFPPKYSIVAMQFDLINF